MEEVVKRIIWIDKNVNSQENQVFLEILKEGIKGAKFYPVESVEHAFYLIKHKKETIVQNDGTKRDSKIFQFRLFYVIVSGSLSNEYFNEYVKATKELTILAANIIFCQDESKHRMNAYYLDNFLNPGKVYNEKSIDKIIEYINKDESPFSNNSSLLENKKIYKPEDETYGDVFFNANNISDITYPYYFGQMINSSLISDFDLEGFQCFLLDYYPELKDLIFPAREKKIQIPYYLLAKFYLHMYTYEKVNFFKNMNFDLSNSKFDIYRVYIFLLYHALNQKSIKQYYNKSLFRGAILSKKEMQHIEKAWKIKEELKKINDNSKNKDQINSCLYFCKNFLSFSKNLDVAKGFMTAGNDNLIPVLFEVEGIDEKEQIYDFLVTNLDLDNITEYQEEEVLFLPFSCFEIVSIKDEEINIFGNMLKVKKINLSYLYKYKTSINEYIQKIKDKEKFEVFLKEVINSAFSNEISEIINFENLDIGKEFQKFFINKLNLKKNFLNIKTTNYIKAKSNNYSVTLFNNLFDEAPKYIEKVLYKGKEAMLVCLGNDKKMIMETIENKVCCNLVNNCNDIDCCFNQRLDLKHCKAGHVEEKLQKAHNEFCEGKNKNAFDKCLQKIEHKDSKLGIINSYYFELYAGGLAIGDFIANYDDIKNEPLIVKLQSFGQLAFQTITPFLPRLLSSILPKAVFNLTPGIMSIVSLHEFILSIRDLRKEQKLTTSQTYSLILKKAGLIIGQIGLQYIVCQIGFKLLMFLQVTKGAVIQLTAIGLGIVTGYAFAKAKRKIINEEDKTENLILFSDSLYYQYIPTKFREYCIPTLVWKGVSNDAKSFAIEMVEDGVRKWLVINIKKWIRKLSIENYFDVGEIIVEYKGISKHPYKVTFILYELNVEKLTDEDWGEIKECKNNNNNEKEKIDKKNYLENLSKYFNQVATLDVF